VTALNETAPLSAETLAKIRRNDERDLRHAEKPDGALDETAWERHVLLAEVDRLAAALADLLGQNAMTESNFDDYAVDAIREKQALTAQVEAAKLMVSRLTSERDQATESAKHMGAALDKVGEVMRNAASTAMELGAGAGMDVIIGYLSDAGMLPESAIRSNGGV